MRRFLLVVGLVALLAQLVAVYAPSAPNEHVIPDLDKVVHFSIFAAPTALFLLAGLRLALVVPLLAAHGPVSEWVQGEFLPHRDGSWQDAAADLVGVAAGWAIVYAFGRRGRGESAPVVVSSGSVRHGADEGGGARR